ncbi:hypothetical protein [Streptomyces zaomyceticus]|uniref:hypothetical protein n=1 Tax=Streptomyces zaomyceticus TaxID=68286 RepID=UPI0037966FFC
MVTPQARSDLLSATGCESVAVGVSWDAVRVPRSIGLIAVDILGQRSGAVIDDGMALYWLLPLRSASQWDIVGTRVLRDGETLSIPPARRTIGPGPHWRICPGEDNHLTPADALRAAVEDAYSPTESETR